MFGSKSLSSSKSLSTKLALFLLGLSIHTMTALPIIAQVDCTDPGSMAPGLGSGNQQPDNGTSAADWTVEAESTLDPKEFEHECFEIRSIVTSDVRIYKTGNDCAKNAYEKLWYHDGHALGMRKQGILSIPADSKVAIRIVEPTCSSGEETKASANIVMRLVLDVLLNKDTITSVTVPSASYQTVLRDLQSRGVKVMPPGEEAPESAKAKFNLQSQSTGMKQAVYFM